jgi:hypothetical protein
MPSTWTPHLMLCLQAILPVDFLSLQRSSTAIVHLSHEATLAALPTSLEV